MPRGPRGEKRPADVIGAAVRVARIATGEEPEDIEQPTVAAELGRRGGLKGGKVRAQRLTPEQRSEAARKAVQARWQRSRHKP
jgi:hypothetical protein